MDTGNLDINSSLIIESQYFGTINYINTLFQFSNIKIEQYETFQKMSFRNRCRVADSNGVLDLTVPVENGRNARGLMKDIRISYREDWTTRHWRTLTSCYQRAPFFEYYGEAVFALLSARPIFLLDLNMSILDWLQKVIKLEGKISKTTEFQKMADMGVKDARNKELPKNYLERPFPIRYTQVFEDRIGFQSNLCILDLLFCAGPAAKDYFRDNKLTF
jgi:hypothetical protein